MIREFSFYAELVPYDISPEELKQKNPKGIIFSGGPSSVYNDNSPRPSEELFNFDLPLLGICYGHQLIVDKFGGKVYLKPRKEHKMQYRWRRSFRDALEIALAIVPYSVTKKDKLQQIIDHYGDKA